MSASAKDPASAADAFLRDAAQFRLGTLLTESSHPRSAALSDVARADAAAGLSVLFDVDRDVVDAFDRWSRSGQPEALSRDVVTALLRGGRLFFAGCGATGRLSIQLASIWRAFWQARRARGALVPDPDAMADRAVSVMAGGDYALIKAVEGFEDLTAFGRKQIADLGVGPRDVAFAITEGGETSFVIGTAWQALAAGARVFFVYNNPDEVLRATVARSREVIDEPRIGKVNLTTGPMALTGSTRMQATSIQLVALLTVLEMALRDVLARAGASEPGAGDAREVPEAMRAGLAALHDRLPGEPLRAALAEVVRAEERIYRAGMRTSYFADALAVDVLTDTTERSPTFCTPSFRKWDDETASESWAFLFTAAETTEDAWTRLLRRAPQTIEWTDAEVLDLLNGDEDAAERQTAVLHEIGLRELFRFRIGLDGLPHRPFRAGDGATAVVTEADLPLLRPGGAFSRELARASAAGAVTSVVAVARAAALRDLDAAAAEELPGCLRVGLAVPDTPFLLDPLTRVGAKLLLNALSTCTMVRLGRALGNRMIWVVQTNLKLIDRSVRYIRDLAGVDYDEACRALFDVLEYVEPRRRAGREYAAPVGIATMRLRHGLSMPEAEARLLEELR
jgi:N-acetylmuramic acid 6-phosphate etherase